MLVDTERYWYLKYYGHHAVKLMDGPREKWISEGRPTSADVPSHPPATNDGSWTEWGNVVEVPVERGFSPAA